MNSCVSCLGSKWRLLISRYRGISKLWGLLGMRWFRLGACFRIQGYRMFRRWFWSSDWCVQGCKRRTLNWSTEFRAWVIGGRRGIKIGRPKRRSGLISWKGWKRGLSCCNSSVKIRMFRLLNSRSWLGMMKHSIYWFNSSARSCKHSTIDWSYRMVQWVRMFRDCYRRLRIKMSRL